MLKFWNRYTRVTALVFGAVSPMYGAADPDIVAIVQRVAPDSVDATVRRLVAFGTRFMGSDSNAVASVWMRDKLAGLGYPAQFDTFDVNVPRRTYSTGQTFQISGLKQWNVIAEKRGVLFPDKKVVLGAHYDTIALDRPQSAQDVAPGANDNASGVAALLEIARLLQDVDLDVTVVFALWGAEELGLIGSRHYAAEARARFEDIVIMIQVDAIGKRSTLFTNGFSIDTIGPYLSQGEALALAATDYSAVRAFSGSGGQVRITPRGCGCSDHQAFIDQGYPALGVFQYFDNPAPHLNMSTDTLDQVDLDLVVGITQTALAGVIQFSGFPSRTPDFDGNGVVGFSDFLLFVQAFESPIQSDVMQFDLDRNGVVGFSDFLIFAGVFGT
jgi:hypothetical protein